jgi:hypothetical protein
LNGEVGPIEIVLAADSHWREQGIVLGKREGGAHA